MTEVYNIKKLKARRINLRNNQTPQEILLWSRLRREQLGYKFRRQHSIGGYIADFYCPAKRLVIEIDGSQHFRKENKKYDEVRASYLEGLNIKILRFSNAEININLDSVVDKVLSTLNDPYPASPLLRGRSKEGVFAD